MLTQEAHVIVSLGGQDVAAVQAVVEVKLLSHVLHITDNLGAEHRASKTATVREETNTCGLAGVEGYVGYQAGKTTIDGSSVHVTAKSGNIQSGTHAFGKGLLGQTHEGLLDVLVGKSLLVFDVAQLRSDLGEGGVRGVGHVVVVEHTAVGLLHQLAGGGVVADVVETVERGLRVVLLNAIGAISSLEGLLASVVGLVAGIDGLSVALEGEVAIDDGVLAGQVGLEEVVGVSEVASTETGLEDNGGVRANQHGHTASTTSRTGSTLGVQGNVTADNSSITTIPGGGLDPVDAVEDGVGTTVAGVDVVNTLNVCVSVRSKELHQDGLDGLGLVEEGLGTDLETTDGVGVDFVLAQERREGSEGDGVDV